MSDVSDLEVDEVAGHVIVSFSVFSLTRIGELSAFLEASSSPTDDFHYRFGTTTFDEPAWERRAERLDAAINAFVDRLEHVPRHELNAAGSFVRLFLTLPSGAETIDASTVKRLADVNATIWIDVSTD